MNADEIRLRYVDELSWPDDRLLEWAASIVSTPKREPADSFVLHAPLELMARAILMSQVNPANRPNARERLVWMVDAYSNAGEAVEPPLPIAHRSVQEAISAVIEAIGESDLDAIDRHASWLGYNASATELREGLAVTLAPSLAAAAHGSIALHLLARMPSIGPSLLRGGAREIGRHPDWVIPWEGLSTGDEPLIDALLRVPLLGMPASSFIRPMVTQGFAAARSLLSASSCDLSDARSSLSRVAAWSMLQDTSEHIPYGWTHTLTIPQAVMSLGLESKQAVSIAASQVIGFRASMSTRALDPQTRLPAISAGSEELATKASLHFDAHLVKYTLATFDAAASDPEMTNLYLAAANRLHEWWESEPDDGFF
jgi:hypothetical protein